ncbi:MAG: HAD family hydrolase [Candidatus Adiutrix sp.]|jgi:phosphoglycolate phosphatase|nr:HAD family hydrolase [Candidatus Adiutrix sp.]
MGPGLAATLWDLDGTLLYTLEDLGDSLNQALAEEGLPGHSYDDYRLMVGNGQRLLVTRALPEDRRDPEKVGRVYNGFTIRYRANQCRKSRPYPGVPELLAELKARGFKLAVLSNKNQDNTTAVVNHYFPGLFEVAWGLSPQRPAKPDPTAALALAETLGLSPDRFIYLGDSAVDMKTAQRAGMWPVGVTWGYRGRAELAAAGAALLVDSPAELQGFVLDLYPAGVKPHGLNSPNGQVDS